MREAGSIEKNRGSGVGTLAQISAVWGQPLSLHFHFFLIKGTTKCLPYIVSCKGNTIVCQRICKC